MTTDEKIKLLHEMFVHRTDTYIEQWVDDQGNTHYTRKPQEVTDEIILQHLQGSKTISVYATRDDDTVKWMCFDVDISPIGKKFLNEEQRKEITKEVTRRVVQVLFKLHIPFRVEQSGNKGYHVWVFFDKPVHTRNAYLVGNFIETHVRKDENVNVEVFPKHKTFAEAPFGFGLKLPLGIHRRTNVRCFFINNMFTPHENQWTILSTVKYLTEERLCAIIEEYQIKEEAEQPKYNNASDYVCMSRVMAEGVDNGNRDEGLFQLSCFMQANNIPYPMAEKIIEEVVDVGVPPLSDQIRTIKLNSAYSKKYFPSPCRIANMDTFCSSSCKRWEKKVAQRWVNYGRDKESAIGKISRD